MNLDYEEAASAGARSCAASGGAIALPFLDAMVRRLAVAAPPSRRAAWRSSISRTASSWIPGFRKTEGEIAPLPEQLPRVLEPLAPYRNDISCSGRPHQRRRPRQGRRPRRPRPRRRQLPHRRASQEDVRQGHSGRRFDRPDRGPGHRRPDTRSPRSSSAAKKASRAATATTAIAAPTATASRGARRRRRIRRKIRPRAVFERLFGSADLERDPVRRARHGALQQAACSTPCWRTPSACKARSAPSDRRKLDEYLYAIREIESRIQKTEQHNAPRVKPTIDDAVRQRAGKLHRAFAAHVRPDDRGVPDRFHARHHLP